MVFWLRENLFLPPLYCGNNQLVGLTLEKSLTQRRRYRSQRNRCPNTNTHISSNALTVVFQDMKTSPTEKLKKFHFRPSDTLLVKQGFDLDPFLSNHVCFPNSLPWVRAIAFTCFVTYFAKCAGSYFCCLFSPDALQDVIFPETWRKTFSFDRCLVFSTYSFGHDIT